MSTQKNLPGLGDTSEPSRFIPTRHAALARLDAFVGRAGHHYARKRNFDFGATKRDNVSTLSPWIRHRLVTEQDVLRATLAKHSVSGAEKFIQEVFWRSYFKGWLEQHPSVWLAYHNGLMRALDNGERTSDYVCAVEGTTGIDCFDHWARELVETGYLHNHARMWFASIWIFTLRLPWELGADFFLRHLIDGDPASNTLGWRWVAGLHTKGKTYLARASNIARYTEGRFNPEGQLAGVAEPLIETIEHPRIAISVEQDIPKGKCVLLITEEDCQPEFLSHVPPTRRLGLLATNQRSPKAIGQHAKSFAEQSVRQVCDVCTDIDQNWIEQIVATLEASDADALVTAYTPVGPVNTALNSAALAKAGVKVHRVRRRYDTLVWPHTAKGFFGLKKKIPFVLKQLRLVA